jgi:hypothetical protein
MKYANRAVIAAVCAAFALAPAAGASAISDCVSKGKQVTEALAAAQPGQSTDAARAQAKAGSSLCASGLYALGVARYSKALELLGKA